MPGTTQGQAGTKQGQVRDKQGHSLSVPSCPTCPCLSLSVQGFPCLSVPVYPCLSLSVPVCLYMCSAFIYTAADEYKSLHWYKHTYIDFPCKSHWVTINLVYNSLFTFHLVSSITLSFNTNSFILKINISKGFNWFLSRFDFPV